MNRSSRKSLQQNPFTTYRDPETGRWTVIHQSPMSDISAETDEAHASSPSPSPESSSFFLKKLNSDGLGKKFDKSLAIASLHFNGSVATS